MGHLLESLKKYFENTPPNIIEKDWKEVEYLNEMGPDVITYAEFIKKYLDVDVLYSNIEKTTETHKFDISNHSNNCISVNALYCLAA